MAAQDCGWKSEGCGALALRWGCCDMIKPSCLPRSTHRSAVPGQARATAGASATGTEAHDAQAKQRTD
jgi:hypothetical protein